MSINILQFTPKNLKLICEISFANNFSFIYPSTTLYSIWTNRTGILSLIKSLAHIILNFIICNLLDSRIVSKIISQINIYYIYINLEKHFHKILLARNFFFSSPTLYRYTWIYYLTKRLVDFLLRIYTNSFFMHKTGHCLEYLTEKDHRQMTQSKYKYTINKSTETSLRSTDIINKLCWIPSQHQRSLLESIYI